MTKELVMNPCKAIPATSAGVDIINQLLKELPVFQNFISDDTRKKAMFIGVFGTETGPHLMTKYDIGRDFGSWFLNLDYGNQIKLLGHMGIHFGPFPEIVNWKEIAAEQEAPADWTMEDVRSCNLTSLPLWVLYPHSLVWINKFLLFCNNNSISKEAFEDATTEILALTLSVMRYKNSGKATFGILNNWKHLWTLFLQSQEKQQFCEFLKTY